MKHLIKKYQPQCMLYSFAMAMDIEPDSIINLLGHNGTDKVFPFPAPKCYRGFHISEMVYTCFHFGFTCYEFPKNLMLGQTPESAQVIIPPYDIGTLLLNHSGVIMNEKHAWAWDRKVVYDPDGPIWAIGEIHWDTFYLIKANNSNNSNKGLINS